MAGGIGLAEEVGVVSRIKVTEVKVSKIAECGWGRDRLKFLYNCLFARGGAWSLACRGGKMPKNNYAAYK